MKKITWFLMFSTAFAFSQVHKEPARLQDSGLHELYVLMSIDLDFDTTGPFLDQAVLLVPEIADIASNYSFSFEKAVDWTEPQLDVLQARITKQSGDLNAVKRIRNLFKVKMPSPDNATLLALAREFERLPQVVFCDLVSTTPPALPNDIPPTTSNLETGQTYINANPGVNMRYAWDMGLNGSGIRVRDVEYGLNTSHEEFNGRPISIAQGMNISTQVQASSYNHGTAVFGIVYADKGTYGVSGMAHGAQEMKFFPEWQQSGWDRPTAVWMAITNSDVGDVILYEMQIQGANGEYVPAEYNMTVWTLTQTATSSGIVVVAAAGNGNEDLDSAPYSSYRNRGDSGAIIVGAGSPNTSHNKLSFSTYGSRVDVQGWGSNVRSTGYGDYLTVGGDDNQKYTNGFGGTSSATPIVASCAIVLQSYFHGLTGDYLDSVELRNLLIDTGIAQGSGGHIGPIPNMQAAIAAVNALALDATASTSDFLIFPNPVTDKINVISDRLKQQAAVTLFNSVGQVVFQGALSSDKTIDVSRFPKGIYFLRIVDNHSISTKKVIKD